MAVGSGNIGTSYRAIANIAIAGETTSNALGFGLPTLDGTAIVTGVGTVTFSPASLSGIGATFIGVGAITCSAASVSG
ncbi:MAG: hypothetical protein VW362_08360, partial [Candidatus Nanopelagicales bacterium]